MDLLLQFLKMVVIDMIFDNRQEDETKWGLKFFFDFKQDSSTAVHLGQLLDCSPALC